MKYHNIPTLFDNQASLINGKNIGTDSVRYIQDAGQKTAGTTYIDRNTNELYVCVTTTDSVNNDGNFSKFNLKEAFNKLDSLSGYKRYLSMYEYETSEKSHKIKHVTSNNGFKIIDGKIHILKSSIYRITASVNVYNQMMIAIQFYYNEVSNSVALDIIKGSGASSSRTVIYDELYALQENDTLDIYFNTHGGELMQNLRTIITEI